MGDRPQRDWSGVDTTWNGVELSVTSGGTGAYLGHRPAKKLSLKSAMVSLKRLLSSASPPSKVT